MSEFRIEALNPATWDAYARFMERHNGVSGGCWCTWFHTMHSEKTFTAAGNRALKHQLVLEGRAHAALVFAGDEAVAWCQYGSPAELPNIYHRKEYEDTLDLRPDYRITCLFVDKRLRRTGMASVALSGALDLIGTAGGGVVEAYPHDNDGVRVSNLYNGTRTLFESAGFTYVRPKGSRNCVMRQTVDERRAAFSKPCSHDISPRSRHNRVDEHVGDQDVKTECAGCARSKSHEPLRGECLVREQECEDRPQQGARRYRRPGSAVR